AALAAFGHRVGILDGDFGLGNVDVMLGLAPTQHLGGVLTGDELVQDITMTGPSGIRIVPAGSGIRSLTALTPNQWDRLRRAVDWLRRDLDVLLIDTAPGVSDNVVDLARLTSHVIVVTSSEPTAIVDAYAMVKLLHGAAPATEIGIIVNDTHADDEGHVVFNQLSMAATRFLSQTLRYYGSIGHDPRMREAVLAQQPIVTIDPDAAASRSYRRLALRVANFSPIDPGVSAVLPSNQPLLTDQELADLEAPRCA